MFVSVQETKRVRIENNSSESIDHSRTQRRDFEMLLKEATELNGKLNRFYESLKRNSDLKKLDLDAELKGGNNNQQKCEGEHSMTLSRDEHDVLKGLQKQERKVALEYQQSTSLLNGLLNQNKKLKEEVDNSRNARMIYSNVYKNVEKEIRKTEYEYKCCLIESMATEETFTRTQERMEKIVKKLEREIEGLEAKVRSQDTKTSRRVQENINTECQEERQAISVLKTHKQIRCQPLKNNCRISNVECTLNKKWSKNSGVDYFELEMKHNYYDNILKKLKETTGLADIEQIASLWREIQQMNEEEYTEYLCHQEKLKVLECHERELRDEIKRYEQEEHDRSKGMKTEKDLPITPEEVEYAELLTLIACEQTKLKHNEEQLTQKIDIGCEHLSNQEITHHIQRIRSHFGFKQLDKILEAVQKTKVADNYITLPKELVVRQM